MKKDDFGFYGKGIDGYVHYRQAMEESKQSRSSSPSPARSVPETDSTPKPPMSGINIYLWSIAAALLIDLFLSGIIGRYESAVLFLVLLGALAIGLVVKLFMLKWKKPED